MKNSENPCERFKVIHKVITILVTLPVIIIIGVYYFNGDLTDLNKLLPPLIIGSLYVLYAIIYEIKCDQPYFLEFFRIRKEMKNKDKMP